MRQGGAYVRRCWRTCATRASINIYFGLFFRNPPLSHPRQPAGDLGGAIECKFRLAGMSRSAGGQDAWFGSHSDVSSQVLVSRGGAQEIVGLAQPILNLSGAPLRNETRPALARKKAHHLFLWLPTMVPMPVRRPPPPKRKGYEAGASQAAVAGPPTKVGNRRREPTDNAALTRATTHPSVCFSCGFRADACTRLIRATILKGTFVATCGLFCVLDYLKEGLLV